MSVYDSIKQLLNIQDPNIFIEEISKKVLKEKACLLVKGKLTYTPPRCPRCAAQCVKNGSTCSNILLLKSAGEKTFLHLKKQRFKCKNCQHTFLAQTALVRPFHHISTPVYHEIFNRLLRRRLMTEIAFDHPNRHPTLEPGSIFKTFCLA